MLSNLKKIESYLNGVYLEREEQIRGLLLSLLAGENVLLIGPAGEAKSELIVELSKCFADVNYFQYLLTQYTVPEELFGAVKLSALEQGIYERNITGKAPESNMMFLDEIFKASSSILNSILTLINEKIFYNNGGIVKVPLFSVIGASNEYIEEGEGLEALDDRFLLRYEVLPVQDNSNFQKILTYNDSKLKANRPSLTLQELVQMQGLVENIGVGQDVLDTISKIRADLSDEGIVPSTRRWRKAVKIVKANSVLNSNKTIAHGDLECLKHILWKKPEEKKIVQSIITKYCVDQFSSKIKEILSTANDVRDNAIRIKTSDAGMEGNKKLKDLMKQLEQLRVDNPAHEQKINETMQQVQALNSEVLTECLGI